MARFVMLGTAVFIFLFFLFVISYCISQVAHDGDYCLSCHNKDVNLNRKFLHPLVKEKKCRACHISYDNNLHKEYDRPALSVCTSCHREEKLGRSHPVGEGIIDPNTNETMTCVSSCHLMHGSDYKSQLPYKNNMELCLSCHKEF